MSSATLSRDGAGAPSQEDEVQRLIVSWQHPVTRALEPVGLLSFDGVDYRFVYLQRAITLEGFPRLLGFPDLDREYESGSLFALFAQRAMDPRRPDFERYVADLALDGEPSPWEQIVRSGGGREGDTLQLFPVPKFIDGRWQCYFLAHGVRHLLEKEVRIDGETKSRYSPEQLEALLSDLEPGDALTLLAEPDNESSKLALLVASESREPIGYVPELLVKALHGPHSQQLVEAKVAKVNPADAGWHLRLLVHISVDLDAEFDFFNETDWPLATD